jgi:hypothetical protein
MKILLDASLVDTFVAGVRRDSSRIAAYHNEHGNHETSNAVTAAAEASITLS